MTGQPNTKKSCVICGEDLQGQVRVKDPNGRYFCEPCFERAKEAKRRRRFLEGVIAANALPLDPQAITPLDGSPAIIPPPAPASKVKPPPTPKPKPHLVAPPPPTLALPPLNTRAPAKPDAARSAIVASPPSHSDWAETGDAHDYETDDALLRDLAARESRWPSLPESTALPETASRLIATPPRPALSPPEPTTQPVINRTSIPAASKFELEPEVMSDWIVEPRDDSESESVTETEIKGDDETETGTETETEIETKIDSAQTRARFIDVVPEINEGQADPDDHAEPDAPLTDDEPISQVEFAGDARAISESVSVDDLLLDELEAPTIAVPPLTPLPSAPTPSPTAKLAAPPAAESAAFASSSGLDSTQPAIDDYFASDALDAQADAEVEAEVEVTTDENEDENEATPLIAPRVIASPRIEQEMLLSDGPPPAAFAGCPHCHRPMATGAIVCLGCGYNIMTGAVRNEDVDRPVVRRRISRGGVLGPVLLGCAMTAGAAVAGRMLFGTDAGLLALAGALLVCVPAWFLWTLLDAKNVEGAQLRIWIVPLYAFVYVFRDSRSNYLRGATVGIVALIISFAALGYDWNQREREKDRSLHRVAETQP